MRRVTRRGGFTMVELMIVVSIIGLLAAVAIPAFQNYQNRSRRAEAFANLGAIAKLEKAYFSEYSAYVIPVGGGSWPGPGAGTLGSAKRAWIPAAETAFANVGFRPDGAVFYDYDVNIDTAQCPRSDCFTTTAYGDADGNGLLSLVMYAQPDASGAVTLNPGYPALGLPLDPLSGLQRTNEVAVNYQADPY